MALSWHQQRVAGMHRMPYDIVGYTYRADIYCSGCCLDRYYRDRHMGINTNRDTVELVEPMLDHLAYVRSIDREDESSYDSGEFPKVVFRDMTDDDTCGSCGRTLGA